MNKDTVTLSKNEYEQLKQQAMAYKKFTANFFYFLIKDSVKDVVNDFRKTNLYADGFLNDLEAGLFDSSYFQNYGHKTPETEIKRVNRRTSTR